MRSTHLPTLSTVNILHWMQENIADQSGKTILITGANSGIGFWTAHIFAQFGAHVILGCRSTHKAIDAVSTIKQDYPNATLDIVEINLADQESIKQASRDILSRFQSIDIVIHNAGISSPATEHDQNGTNLTFATNHLGTYALTAHILPLLLANPLSRIVTQSSITHQLHFLRPRFDRYLTPHTTQNHAYADSKLANLLFARHLQRLLRRNGHPQFSLAAHPGLALTQINQLSHSLHYTDFWSDIKEGAFNRLGLRTANALGLCQPFQIAGALPAVYAAVCDLHSRDFYFGPNGTLGLLGIPTACHTSRYAQCPNLASQLWQISEKMTGLKIKM